MLSHDRRLGGETCARRPITYDQEARQALSRNSVRHPLSSTLTRHREIDAAQASRICQRPVEFVSERQRSLAREERLLDVGGSGRTRYHRLSRAADELLLDSLSYVVDRRLTQENARARVLNALEQNSLNNSDIRENTQLSRNQALALMKGLEKEGLVTLRQAKRGSRWTLRREDA